MYILQLKYAFVCHQGRTNLPPEKVPWDAFRTLLSQCIYGGKIDNEFDQVHFSYYLCVMLVVFAEKLLSILQ